MTSEFRELLWDMYLFDTAMLTTGAFAFMSFIFFCLAFWPVVEANRSGSKHDPRRAAWMAAGMVCLLVFTCALTAAANALGFGARVATQKVYLELKSEESCGGDDR